MTVIIGENDCGKTSVMLALEVFFEGRKLNDPADYFKKIITNPVVIEADFENIGDKFTDYGLGEKDKATISRTYEFDKSAVNQILIKGKWKNIPQKKFDSLRPDFVLVPAARNLESQGKMTTTSLFGKLFRPLIKQVVEGEGAESAEELRKKIRFGVTKRINDLQSAMREQLNNPELSLGHDIEIDQLKGIDIPVEMSDERVDGIPISNRGAGVQNSFILGLFRTYAKYETEDFILAIEEPENSLHPRAQREMMWAMQDFSHTSQVICTTHSPVFLDIGRLEDNIVLRRKSDGATETSYFCLESPDEVNELRDLLGIRVSDALLGGGGNCTLIVEGDTELYAYPHFFRCIGINSRSLGLSIVSAGGGDMKKMLRHARVLKAYGLPCIIVVDKDKFDDARKIEARNMPNVKSVHALTKGAIEEYLPLEIMVEVINRISLDEVQERGQENVKPISKFDIDESKPLENQLRQLVDARYLGVRFDHMKVHLGEEVGKLMVERGIKPHDEIITILKKAEEVAK
jgi:predicted ATP-dependent endonuclease of OLD family